MTAVAFSSEENHLPVRGVLSHPVAVTRQRDTPLGTGHGLGLAIARRIARLHGGDLTCDASTTGAAFTLRLPYQRRAPAAMKVTVQ
jgi:nitrogen-specific signal transduction histidine kinase